MSEYGQPAPPGQSGGTPWPGAPVQPGYAGQPGYGYPGGATPGGFVGPDYATPGYATPGYATPGYPAAPGYPGAPGTAQPGYGAYPGAAPGGPAPKKRRRWVLPVVLGVVLVLGGCGAGIAALIHSASGPTKVVGGYLGDVRAGRYQEAYGRLCGSLRSQGSSEAFATVMKRRDASEGPITKFRTNGYWISSGNGNTSREVTVALTRGGRTQNVDYQVGKDGKNYCLLST